VKEQKTKVTSKVKTPFYPPSVKDALKSEVNLVDAIIKDGTDLKGVGNGEHIGLCPLHTRGNGTPSLCVNEGKGLFDCKTCGKKGDIYNWYNHKEDLTISQVIEKFGYDKVYNDNKALYDSYQYKPTKKPLSVEKIKPVMMIAPPSLLGTSDFPTNTPLSETIVKRTYKNLKDYAMAQGVSEDVFIKAGWYENNPDNPTYLEYTVDDGYKRKRFIDKSSKAKFKSPYGVTASFYGLKKAIAMIKQGLTDLPLILCNGEPSVVVAQHYMIPAFSGTCGERLTKDLKNKLKDIVESQGVKEIWVCYDADSAGIEGSKSSADFINSLGINYEVLQLEGLKGYDLANFCKDNGENSPSELKNVKKYIKLNSEDITKDLSMEVYVNCAINDNDDTLSDIFKEFYKDKYFSEYGGAFWYEYNGKFWEKMVDISPLMMAIREMLCFCPSEKRIKSGVTAASIARIYDLIKFSMSVPPSVTNNSKNYIYFNNGRLSIDTFEFEPLKPSFYNKGISEFDYNPNAKCELFSNKVTTMLQSCYPNDGNNEVTKFIQRYFGYALTQDTSEQTAVFMVGTPGCGKNTIVDTIERIFKYTTVRLASSDLTDKFSITPDRLTKSMAIAGETVADISEITPLLNKIVGGETLETRIMHSQNFYSFVPTCKIIWLMNELPRVKSGSDGVYRRAAIIKMKKSFKPNELDKRLKEKFLSESSGIINWVLQGLREYKKMGLNEPDYITKARNSYEVQNNPVLRFLNDNLVSTIKHNEPTYISFKDVKQIYVDWCNDEGIAERFRLKQSSLKENLINRGYEVLRSTRHSNKLMVKGLRAKTVNDLDNEINESEDNGTGDKELYFNVPNTSIRCFLSYCIEDLRGNAELRYKSIILNDFYTQFLSYCGIMGIDRDIATEGELIQAIRENNFFIQQSKQKTNYHIMGFRVQSPKLKSPKKVNDLDLPFSD
jgi:P4 family phage/plasmid primase-like protien